MASVRQFNYEHIDTITMRLTPICSKNEKECSVTRYSVSVGDEDGHLEIGVVSYPNRRKLCIDLEAD